VSASPERESDILGDAKVDGACGGHSGQNSKKPEKDSTLCNENQIMKLMKKIEELEEKNHKLEGMKIMLFIQTQRQLVQLQRYEAMDMRGPNIVSETVETHLQWSGHHDVAGRQEL
ncbi:Hypothetical predicted protein, partial [Paramuricea clavata]